jgi:outer membrane protein
MRTIILAATLAVFLVANVKADTIGLYLGGYVWDNHATGLVGEKSDLIDFNLKDQYQGSYVIAFEHPLPLLPNMMISSTELTTKGSTQLTEEFLFADQKFSSGTLIDTGFDASYRDYTLYYELFDNGLLSFDFGVTARDFDINVRASNDAVTSELSGSEFIPVLYASATIGLPFTGWNVFGQGHFLSLGDHTIHDYQVGISYEVLDNVMVDFNLILGYRSARLQLEDLDNLSTDIEFDGLYLGGIVHF